MKIDFTHISNEIKSLLKENKKLPLILGVSVSLTIVIGTIIYFRRKNRIVRYAQKFVGQEEYTGNQGFKDPEFDALMREYGNFNNGQEWCQSFAKVIWIKKFGRKYADELNKLITPSTQNTYANFVADTSGHYKVSKEPKKGDMVIWQWYQSGVPLYKGHAGIVQDVRPNEFDTIEGNVSDENGVGYIVSEKTRIYDFDKTNGLKLKGFISINK